VLAQLIPIDGGETITIDRDVTVVGRTAEHCDVVLARKSISKLHCVIVKTDGLLFIRDLSSTNGTKVNGQRIMRGALLPGDQLSFAGARFRVHMGPGPAVSDSKAAPRTEELDDLPPLPDVEHLRREPAPSSPEISSFNIAKQDDLVE
jgi:pSer/pThr/pTyr-binding forkhead associated (FHA) protein